MNLLYILLLVLWSAFNASDAWDPDYNTTTASPDARNTTTTTTTTTTTSVTDASDAWDPDYNTTTASPDPWHTTTTSVTETRSFLIYNEDHNKCVTVVNTNVEAAPCDESSKAQHFRWISSSRIISLSYSLCLGAEKIENWAKIILLPCNESNPRQTWECKDENLFGLKGHPLHLNYGNNDKKNMMLFNGTGVSSRWLIYGTEENLCSHGYQEMSSTGGNSCGKPCHFPFKFGDKWYADCTVDGRKDGLLWCSTEKDFNIAGKWGFCPPKNVPVPSIAVYGHMQDREHVIVMCSFGWRFTKSSFQLSVAGEHNYTLKYALCYSDEECVFDVKVSPPVSFTCVHKINSAVNHQSETYTYSPSAQATNMNTTYNQTQNLAEDQHEKGVSLFYIGFFSCVAVGLVIVTVAMIIRSKSKSSVITGNDTF